MKTRICKQSRHAFLGLAMVAMFACSPSRDPYLGERDIATIFATTGQQTTRIDLAAEKGLDCPLQLIGKPKSAELDGAILKLNHSQAIHEGIRLRLCGEGVAEPQVGVVWNTVQPIDAPKWPLSVSDDGHYLVDQSGTAIFWIGGTAWSIAAETTREEARLYLADRAAKGVNVVLASLIEHKFSDGQPPWENAYGSDPFRAYIDDTTPDMSTPSGPYWRHVDWIIREAYAHGITLLAVPSYVGYQLGRGGWGRSILRNGSRRLSGYGRWLGERYRSFPNIVWVMGGDWSTVFENIDISDEVDALARGILSTSKMHLMTAHPRPGHSARDDYDRPWLSLNSTYGSPLNIYELVKAHYNRRPTLPTFLIEGHYGNERGMTDAALRGQMYGAMLAGAFGHVYGNAPQWYFSAKAVTGFADMKGLAWEENLDNFGALSLRVYAELIEKYPVQYLEPVFDHSIVRPRHNTTADIAIPMRYSPRLAIAYLYEAAPVIVDYSEFASSVTVTWKDPIAGQERFAGTIDSKSLGTIEPPGAGDWILILDARPKAGDGRQAADVPAPR